MGFPLHFAKFVVEVSRQLVNPLPESGGAEKAVSLGWPDMLFGLEEMAGLFPGEPLLGAPVIDEESSNTIKSYHNIQSKVGRLVSAEYFFNKIGYELDCIDIARLRGGEIIADLAVRNSVAKFAGKYGLVIDNGTSEHIFDVATALVNIASLVRLGGCVIHGNPFFMPNHGFWSFNPTLYLDFYESNGFAVEGIYLCSIDSSVEPIKLEKRVYARRFRLDAPGQYVVWAVARRISPLMGEFVFPVQSKYQAMLSRDA